MTPVTSMVNLCTSPLSRKGLKVTRGQEKTVRPGEPRDAELEVRAEKSFGKTENITGTSHQPSSSKPPT
ncbi:hypothetical protein RRG08_024644 [Elysia crispata]|uniref:Uncharacterized protein n=1 Tax=Elysia crispata TaxID=231223 RepID=A0AAE0ZWJ0_9GAST|nr:hypothetical protein RRG08_024644 [Elysia crispata]